MDSWIVDVTDEDFEAEVIEASKRVPVVVDFWAEWCQPCLMLKPLLERLAQEFGGRFRLAKANTNEAPLAARDFNVQSIPAVFALVGGEVVDFLQGLVPEKPLRAWIERLLERGELLEIQTLEQTDPRGAAERYRSLAERHPQDSGPVIGLARSLLAAGEDDEPRRLIEELERRGFLEPEAEKIKSALHLRAAGGEAPDLETLRRDAEARPDDLEARMRWGEALAGAQQYREALDVLLEIVERDRQQHREAARERMVDIFRVLPGDSELTREYRRKLSSALY